MFFLFSGLVGDEKAATARSLHAASGGAHASSVSMQAARSPSPPFGEASDEHAWFDAGSSAAARGGVDVGHGGHRVEPDTKRRRDVAETAEDTLVAHDPLARVMRRALKVRSPVSTCICLCCARSHAALAALARHRVED